MKKKKVLVLGVNSPEQQTVIQVVLAKHRVEFAASPEEAIRSCRGADILAIHTDHEGHVPACYKQGFGGVIIPLLVGKKQSMRIGGELIEAVSVRNLPNKVLELFRQTTEALAT